MCEGQLIVSECFQVLSTFQNNKTPGNDGLSAEFYKFFWPEIGFLLVSQVHVYSRSVYNHMHKLIDAGFLTVRDIFDSKGNFKGLSFPRLLHLSPTDHFLLVSLVDAIPEVWHKQLKANGFMTSFRNEHHIDLNRFSLHLEGKKIYTDKIQSYCIKSFFSNLFRANGYEKI